MECLIDVLAKEISCAADDFRSRNLVRPIDMPYRVGTTLLGNDMIYENADFHRSLITAIEASGYSEQVHVTTDGERSPTASVAVSKPAAWSI